MYQIPYRMSVLRLSAPLAAEQIALTPHGPLQATRLAVSARRSHPHLAASLRRSSVAGGQHPYRMYSA